MKRVSYLLGLVALLGACTMLAQQNKQQSNQTKTTPSKQAAPASKPPPAPKIHNVNPTGDRKVGEGYGKAQQENRKKRHTDKGTAVASTRG
jgi:hypothetical protein